MGDVDWSKRSYGGYYGGADAFSSMGDVDWSKRSVGPAHQFGSDSKDKRAGGLYRSWLSRQNSPGIGQSRYHVSLRYWLHRTCVNVFLDQDCCSSLCSFSTFSFSVFSAT